MALIEAGRQDALPASGACRAPLPTGAITSYPTPNRSPRGNPPARGPLELMAALCAAGRGEGGGSAFGAFAAAIELGSEGAAPEWIQVFPRGPRLAAVPADGRSWTLSDPAAVAAASMAPGLDLPIDINHAQPRKAHQGEDAPAYGWIKEMAVRDGLLEARVEWTVDGKAAIESKRYRYFSPHFLYEKSGEVRSVKNGALVNEPAFAMPALAGAQANGGDPMNEKILKALGLAAGATEEEALAALDGLKSDLQSAKASAQLPSLEKFVPRADYDAVLTRASAAETKLADAAKAGRDEEIKALLDKAQADGKITPATREFYEASCRAEGGIERFKAFAASAPEIAKPSGLTGSESAPGGETQSATADERRVASALGLTPAFIREHAGGAS